MSELHKFLFEGLPVRGMVVRLTDAWREILSRRRTDDAANAWPWPVVGREPSPTSGCCASSRTPACTSTG